MSPSQYHPISVVDLKKICSLFDIAIDDMLDENKDIFQYHIVDRYLPYGAASDTEHTIIDAGLNKGATLRRFQNVAGDKCSAIYVGSNEVYWHYRQHEIRMIHDWNNENDR